MSRSHQRQPGRQIDQHLRTNQILPDSSTFDMEPALLETALSRRSQAIIVVHLFGLVADMDPIMATARERGILVIEEQTTLFTPFAPAVGSH